MEVVNLVGTRFGIITTLVGGFLVVTFVVLDASEIWTIAGVVVVVEAVVFGAVLVVDDEVAVLDVVGGAGASVVAGTGVVTTGMVEAVVGIVDILTGVRLRIAMERSVSLGGNREGTVDIFGNNALILGITG